MVKKSKKHESLLKDYDKAKQDQLEKLANRLLKVDEKYSKLKDKAKNKKKNKNNFLDKF